MKILFLAPHLSTGGMPQFLLKRIEVLKQHTKHEIYVVEYQCYSIDFVVQRDAIMKLVGDNFTTLYEDKMALMNVISDFKPDIIHIDEMAERLDRDMVKALYSNNRKYRIVETCHDIAFSFSQKIFKPDLYLFCTPYHVDTFGVSNYKVIEYPIDDNRDKGWKKNVFKDAVNFERKQVINVGLWTKGKNQGEGLEIARKYPNIDFHFIGNQAGNFKDYWEPLMKDVPKNVKIWGERNDVDMFMKTADVFMFNSTWECNPLVLREAISYGLPIIAHNLPQYKDMFTKYIQPIDTDLNTIEANYEVPTDNTSPWFMAQHDLAYQDILSSPIVQQEVVITQYFVNQPFLEINCPVDETFMVEFFDEKGVCHYSNVIKSNSWVRMNRQWFTKWRTKVTCRATVIYDKVLNYEGKRVLIVIDSDSLGDNLAWVPYCLEFQKKHKCKVIVSTNRTELFGYPELEFVERGVTVHNIHGQYNVGWYYDADKEPELCNIIPLQKAATNILGLEYKEIRPVLKFESTGLQRKVVTIATNSTAGCKFWTREGWQTVINHLTKIGYKVINVSREKNPLDNCTSIEDTSIENTMRVIDESEFFIGLSSGLSWLAWALEKQVIMISNFTEDGHEFSLDTIRITNPSVCHGCWNNKNFKFDRGDWDWCPVNKGTSEQYICHTSIAPEMVIRKISKLIKSNYHIMQTIEGQPWSSILGRGLHNEGDIIDVGCYNWDWSSSILGKKRIIGIDPIEKNIPEGAELFKGVLGPSNGKVYMDVNIDASTVIPNTKIIPLEVVEVDMLCWKTFCNKYGIENVSVLKLNIEGSEYPLLNSMDVDDFAKIDQIAVSFHDWMIPKWKHLTEASLLLLKNNGFEIMETQVSWGWYLAYKP